MFAGASLDENSGAFCELKANFFRLILTKAELSELRKLCLVLSMNLKTGLDYFLDLSFFDLLDLCDDMKEVSQRKS